MKRFIVVFDVCDEKTQLFVQTVRLFNDYDRMTNFVTGYIDQYEPERYWATTDDEEELKKLTVDGKMIMSLHGYRRETPDETDLPDIISIYSVDDEDPENDPYRVILNNCCNELSEAASVDNVDAKEKKDILTVKGSLEYILKSIDEKLKEAEK